MANRNVTLYFFPSSYYSLKVLLALYEKGIPFNQRYVNIFDGEQKDESYLKKNPNGEVPLLELDGEYIAESDVIIDVIDHTFTSDPHLVPALDTSRGQEIRAFRQMLDEISVAVITFGVLANRQLCTEEMKPSLFASLTKDAVQKRFEGNVKDLLQKQQTCSSEVRSAIDRKLQKSRNLLETVMNVHEVSKCLDGLEQVFDKIEQQLIKSNVSVNDSSEETWLFGSSFTAADISATILMFRLTVIGVGPRYFSANVRPSVNAYFQRVMTRPSVQKCVVMFNSTKGYLMRQTAKQYGKKVLKAGLVIGLVAVGILAYKEYAKIHKGVAKV